jgi:hypothetical protein
MTNEKSSIIARFISAAVILNGKDRVSQPKKRSENDPVITFAGTTVSIEIDHPTPLKNEVKVKGRTDPTADIKVIFHSKPPDAPYAYLETCTLPIPAEKSFDLSILCKLEISAAFKEFSIIICRTSALTLCAIVAVLYPA